jgi:hypothetical protein
MSVHADTEFTLYERHVIAEAVRQLQTQAGITINVTYDLDYEKLERLVQFADKKTLTRVSETAPIVGDIDARVRGKVYGWTILDRKIWLVWDRMYSEQHMLHVVCHELLHALGVEHVSDPRAIMYEITNEQHLSITLTEADREAIRRAHKDQNLHSMPGK